MGEVVPDRTSPTLLPHPLTLCCHYPVSKCCSASIVVTSTVLVNLIFAALNDWLTQTPPRTDPEAIRDMSPKEEKCMDKQEMVGKNNPYIVTLVDGQGMRTESHTEDAEGTPNETAESTKMDSIQASVQEVNEVPLELPTRKQKERKLVKFPTLPRPPKIKLEKRGSTVISLGDRFTIEVPKLPKVKIPERQATAPKLSSTSIDFGMSHCDHPDNAGQVQSESAAEDTIEEYLDLEDTNIGKPTHISIQDLCPQPGIEIPDEDAFNEDHTYDNVQSPANYDQESKARIEATADDTNIQDNELYKNQVTMNPINPGQLTKGRSSADPERNDSKKSKPFKRSLSVADALKGDLLGNQPIREPVQKSKPYNKGQPKVDYKKPDKENQTKKPVTKKSPLQLMSSSSRSNAEDKLVPQGNYEQLSLDIDSAVEPTDLYEPMEYPQIDNQLDSSVLNNHDEHLEANLDVPVEENAELSKKHTSPTEGKSSPDRMADSSRSAVKGDAVTAINCNSKKSKKNLSALGKSAKDNLRNFNWWGKKSPPNLSKEKKNLPNTVSGETPSINVTNEQHTYGNLSMTTGNQAIYGNDTPDVKATPHLLTSDEGHTPAMETNEDFYDDIDPKENFRHSKTTGDVTTRSSQLSSDGELRSSELIYDNIDVPPELDNDASTEPTDRSPIEAECTDNQPRLSDKPPVDVSTSNQPTSSRPLPDIPTPNRLPTEPYGINDDAESKETEPRFPDYPPPDVPTSARPTSSRSLSKRSPSNEPLSDRPPPDRPLPCTPPTDPSEVYDDAGSMETKPTPNGRLFPDQSQVYDDAGSGPPPLPNRPPPNIHMDCNNCQIEGSDEENIYDLG